MSQDDDYNIAEVVDYNNDENDYSMNILQTQEDQKDRFVSGSSQVRQTEEAEFKNDIESSDQSSGYQVVSAASANEESGFGKSDTVYLGALLNAVNDEFGEFDPDRCDFEMLQNQLDNCLKEGEVMRKNKFDFY